jgi:hypothetical protein
MWLHLCSQLLPRTSADMFQTNIILKYYNLAKDGDSLASLRFIRTLTEELMSDISHGISNTILWLNIY